MKQRFDFLLLLNQLICSLLDDSFQIVSVLLHHYHNVVKYVGFPESIKVKQLGMLLKFLLNDNLQPSFHLFESSTNRFKVRSHFWGFVPALLHATDNVVFAV